MKPLEQYETTRRARPVTEPVSFVVHVWFEAADPAGAGGEWRGRVTSVLDERTVYFRSLAKLEAAVRGLLAEVARQEPARR